MKLLMPDILLKTIKELKVGDVTYEFTRFLINQAENDVHKEQKSIAEIQKKYNISTLDEMEKKYINKKDHDFKTDEAFRSWDAAETIIKNRYKEIDSLRRFLS